VQYDRSTDPVHSLAINSVFSQQHLRKCTHHRYPTFDDDDTDQRPQRRTELMNKSLLSNRNIGGASKAYKIRIQKRPKIEFLSPRHEPSGTSGILTPHLMSPRFQRSALSDDNSE
jgi:hypothetical protein